MTGQEIIAKVKTDCARLGIHPTLAIVKVELLNGDIVWGYSPALTMLNCEDTVGVFTSQSSQESDESRGKDSFFVPDPKAVKTIECFLSADTKKAMDEVKRLNEEVEAH